MVDIYLFTISFRLNAIMKVVTLIFHPVYAQMTFVAGVYAHGTSGSCPNCPGLWATPWP